MLVVQRRRAARLSIVRREPGSSERLDRRRRLAVADEFAEDPARDRTETEAVPGEPRRDYETVDAWHALENGKGVRRRIEQAAPDVCDPALSDDSQDPRRPLQ